VYVHIEVFDFLKSVKSNDYIGIVKANESLFSGKTGVLSGASSCFRLYLCLLRAKDIGSIRARSFSSKATFSKNLYPIIVILKGSIMKHLIKLFGVLLGIFLFSGCDNDDSTTTEQVPGQWSLVNVSGGIAGINDSFPEGTIKWTYDEDTSTVTVVNNNADESLEDIFATGTYNLSIIPSDNPSACPQQIIIYNMNLGCQNINGDEMTFNQAVDDGYILTLVR
jgi:hypothetical protein